MEVRELQGGGRRRGKDACLNEVGACFNVRACDDKEICDVRLVGIMLILDDMLIFFFTMKGNDNEHTICLIN